MSNPKDQTGHIVAAGTGQTGLLVVVGVFSVAVNLLLLTGPLYMLQVYDRVLTGRSESTLLALSLLAIAMFMALGVLDHARGRVLARIGFRMQHRLDRAVLIAAQARGQAEVPPPLATQDLDAVQRLWTTPVMSAVFDLAWSPVFLMILFGFGAPLGWLALLGAFALVALAAITRRVTKARLAQGNHQMAQADATAADMVRVADTLRGLGMTERMADRWQNHRRAGQQAHAQALDRAGTLGALGRSLRLMMQSAILALGAWLVLQDRLSGGAMVAASVLMGRVLQPIEQLTAQWQTVITGAEARRRLARLLNTSPNPAERLALPRPAAQLKVDGLVLPLPGKPQPVLRGISFSLKPGDVLGVIGASGAGKTCLARALTGAWPSLGTIRLDGASPDQFGQDGYGRLVGYLPQHPTLFAGTIAENIARFDTAATAQGVVQAATLAGAHQMILRLPLGYDTPLLSGMALSGGQAQLVGLARALYGNPVLLVLDEPQANLDANGQAALAAAIAQHRMAGGIAVIMAHAHAALQDCTLLAVLEGGLMRAFGPKEGVMRHPARSNLHSLAPGVGR